jgi:predicted RNase H-related nuclease YkuK (DUF458 family)
MKSTQGKYGYSPFAEWGWRSYDGKRKIDVLEFVKSKKEDNFFFIGTDSQNYSKKRTCLFTTVLIAYRMGKGGSVILHRDSVPYMDALRLRLLMEAMRSLEVGWWLTQHIPKENVIGIHLDVNQSLKFKSGQYKDELIGLVASQGFTAIVKPDSFAASKCADRKC